jgi:hypothetical protein
MTNASLIQGSHLKLVIIPEVITLSFDQVNPSPKLIVKYSGFRCDRVLRDHRFSILSQIHLVLGRMNFSSNNYACFETQLLEPSISCLKFSNSTSFIALAVEKESSIHCVSYVYFIMYHILLKAFVATIHQLLYLLPTKNQL